MRILSYTSCLISCIADVSAVGNEKYSALSNAVNLVWWFDMILSPSVSLLGSFLLLSGCFS